LFYILVPWRRFATATGCVPARTRCGRWWRSGAAAGGCGTRRSTSSKTGGKPTLAKLGKLLTEARTDNVWLREGWQDAQQGILRIYLAALKHSFTVKGRGRPKVKKRKSALLSLEFSRNGFAIVEGRLRLPKGTLIPVVWSRELPSAPTSVRVYQDSLGHWYASFVVRRQVEPSPEVEGGIGIDWGVMTTATTTDPDFDLPHGGARKAAATELKAAQRTMARRRRPKHQGQSKGYQRAKRQAAKVATKAARRNTHTARVWARRVVADHQLIAIEDFRPRFLAKSTMAKKTADAAISLIKRTLIEYGVRAFTCPVCGLIADRDVNAARVILAVVERGHTSVESVRHSGPPPEGVAGAA
jgi:putative transposase